MIFVTNAAGKAIYLGAEWTELTGQTLAEAVDYGWVRVVHPEDRAMVRSVVAEAIRRKEPFTVRYRLLNPEGQHAWVLGGAVPSFGPPDRSFLGFLGSITRIADADAVQGTIGSFDLPPDRAVEPARNNLERAADNLITAHALLERSGGRHLLTGLRTVLYQLGLELAKNDRVDGLDQVH